MKNVVTILAMFAAMQGTVKAGEVLLYGVHAPTQATRGRSAAAYPGSDRVHLKEAGNFGGLGVGGVWHGFLLGFEWNRIAGGQSKEILEGFTDSISRHGVSMPIGYLPWRHDRVAIIPVGVVGYASTDHSWESSDCGLLDSYCPSHTQRRYDSNVILGYGIQSVVKVTRGFGFAFGVRYSDEQRWHYTIGIAFGQR